MDDEKQEIGKGYYFELMDRCHVQMVMIEEFLIDNPHIQSSKKHRKRLEKAQELIMDVYQWAGNKDYEEKNGK